MARPLLRLQPTLRRLYSTTTTTNPPPPSSLTSLPPSQTTPSAQSIASQFLTRYTSLPPQIRTQTLDANQLLLLHSTLNRPPPRPIQNGTPIPACYHLVYFTPSQIEAELGLDGTDRTYNPDVPFTRRMWAGGELHWEEGNLLRVGEEVTETTVVKSAEGKRTKAGEEMVVVGVEKRFENARGVAVVDRRNWIFRPEITTPLPPSPQPATIALPSGPHTRDFTQTPVTLFRYSALTFNGHKIHYNRDWCREVEGHRELVVHGPLNLTNMVDLWVDVVGKAKGDGKEVVWLPKSVKYRATNPLYAGERYRILLEEGKENEKVTEVWIVDSFGNVGMRGSIESF